MSTAVRSGNNAAVSQESFVIFGVGTGDYAIETASVVEVLRMVALTRLPDAPPWLAGALNLRGRVLPVIDLRARMGFDIPPVELSTPIIIAEDGDVQFGLIADAVEGMASIPAAEVVWHQAGEGKSFVRGIARLEGRLAFIADLGRIYEGAAAFVPNVA